MDRPGTKLVGVLEAEDAGSARPDCSAKWKRKVQVQGKFTLKL